MAQFRDLVDVFLMPSIKLSRPPSVWIAQILLSLLALVFIFMTLFVFVVNIPANLFGLLFIALYVVLFVVVPIAAAVGMAKRKNWGRWLGVGILTFIFILSVIGQILQPDGPIQRYEYSNATQQISGVITQVLLTGLFLLLILRLSFSQRVSQFFSQDLGGDDSQTESLMP